MHSCKLVNEVMRGLADAAGMFLGGALALCKKAMQGVPHRQPHLLKPWQAAPDVGTGTLACSVACSQLAHCS